MSEGAGILVFEELEHAKRRGARIYAEVLGFGASGDAGHITSPDEHGPGAARAMGDKAETQAVKRVFGEHARRLSISSTKSALGHSLGASGGIEGVITVKAVCANTAPPTINLDTPDPECDLDYTPNVPKERRIDVAMSNSFGFGGHNASIIIGRLKNGAH
jgi:3-oxoacyl-[acyl-carrier-protein] synthase II